MCGNLEVGTLVSHRLLSFKLLVAWSPVHGTSLSVSSWVTSEGHSAVVRALLLELASGLISSTTATRQVT